MDTIDRGDTVELIGGSPKYLNGLKAIVLEKLNVNFKVQLVQSDRARGRRYGDGPFATPPSLIRLHKKGDGTIPATVVTNTTNDNDDDNDGGDNFEGGDSGLTIHDFKGRNAITQAITGPWVRPRYIANQPVTVRRVQRTRIAVSFDNPIAVAGTRYSRGLLVRPKSLIRRGANAKAD